MDRFETVALAALKESPLNPRKNYDPKKIEELAESIKSVGIIEPIVVRATDSQNDHLTAYEIIAGSRRGRAAKLAGLAEVPIIVRDLNDEKALEIMVIENNQREDVNALEEAEGYDRLLRRGYLLERLAEKIGRSIKYIYDRMKLLQLVPEAKRLLLDGRMTAGHAILLARLKPKEQARAIDPETGGLFDYERVDSFDFDENGKDRAGAKIPQQDLKYRDRKPRSVRELESWINDHCRFDRAAPIDQLLFPETAIAVKRAVEEKEKIIQITHDYYIQPSAKEDNKERIYTERAWKLADGSGKKAPTCEKSVTGVVVVGPKRGTAQKVCVHKECPVHWGAEKRARERRAKLNGKAPGQDHWAKQRERQQAEQKKREERQSRWKKALPAIIKACIEKVKSAEYGPLAQVIDRAFRGKALNTARSLLPKSKTTDGLVRIAVLAQLINEADEWFGWEEFPARAKHLCIDVKAIVEEANPKPLQTSAKSGSTQKRENAKKAKANGAAGNVVHALHGGRFDEPTCIGCGCQEMSPCPEGCSWKRLELETNRGLCTACAAKGIKWILQNASTSATAKKKAKKRPASKKKSARSLKAAEAAARA
jgi:ParB/RepB/Spo0J family partition protein